MLTNTSMKPIPSSWISSFLQDQRTFSVPGYEQNMLSIYFASKAMFSNHIMCTNKNISQFFSIRKWKH